MEKPKTLHRIHGHEQGWGELPEAVGGAAWRGANGEKSGQL